MNADTIISDWAKAFGVDECYIKLLGACVVIAGVIHTEVCRLLVDKELRTTIKKGKTEVECDMFDLLKMTSGKDKIKEKIKENFPELLEKYIANINKRNSIIHIVAPIDKSLQKGGFLYIIPGWHSQNGRVAVITRKYLEGYLLDSRALLIELNNKLKEKGKNEN